jgi:hypothetical protein
MLLSDMDRLQEYNNYINSIKDKLEKIEQDRNNIPNHPILKNENLLIYDVFKHILYHGNDFDRSRAIKYFEKLNDSQREYQLKQIISYQEFLNKFYPNE